MAGGYGLSVDFCDTLEGGGGGGREVGVWEYDRHLFHHLSEQSPRCGQRSLKLNSTPLLLPTLTTVHPVSSAQWQPLHSPGCLRGSL